MQNKNTIITFDYELFLGEKSGTAQKSILEPTDKIITLLKQYKAKAIFFVDTTYLMTLKKYNHRDFFKISKQLQEIVKIGSSVELHLHPQWLDAKPNKNEWIFESFNRYRLHSLSQQEIIKLFEEGSCLLEDITNTKIQAFRAGGWSITPFEKLKEAFVKCGIKIDMSVLPNFYKNELPMHYYDFRNVSSKNIYKFEDDVSKENKDGTFLEIPVTTYYVNGIDLVINNLIKKIKYKPIYGDGKGLKTANENKNKFLRIFKKNIRNATFEGQSEWFFNKSLKLLEKLPIIHFVSHPKTFNQTALNNMEKILKKYNTLNTNDILKEFM